ncbi:MAG: HAMP domain-containing protein [Actinomycetia bacterium]|nr:HAMP domain-containing protein [Actinomycetes bacterium]
MSRLWSVRARITLASTVLVAVAIGVAAVMIVQTVERDLVDAAESTLDEALDQQAEAIEELQEAPRAFTFEADDIEFTAGPFSPEEDGELVGRIVSDDGWVGEMVIDAETGEVYEVLDRESDETIDEPELIEAIQDTIFEVRLVESGDGTQIVVAGEALDEVRQSVAAVEQALWATGPLLVLGCGILVWFVVGRALRPVRAISGRVEQITVESLYERVPVPRGNDEITELATLMNSMLERVEQGAELQRQFAADASHELRSPLSSVTLAAELIRSDPGRERSGRWAGDIVAEAGRMERLISDLLLLARTDGDATPFTNEVDLVSVAAVAASDLGAEFRASVGAAVVRGDASSLERVVTNLVENAFRHGGGEARVTIEAGSKGIVRLMVEDDGPGIPPDQRARVFERFTRLDEARTRQTGGTGIGLALVAAITRRHGGVIHLDESPDLDGARFRVDLPRVADRREGSSLS